MPSKFGPSLDLSAPVPIPPIQPNQYQQSKFGPSVNLDQLESRRVGPVHEVSNEWGEPGPVTQWINSPGILPGMLKGILETGGILPSPLSMTGLPMPRAPNLIPGLTAPIGSEGQTALPKIPWLGKLAIGKVLGPAGKLGMEVYENMRGASAPPQMAPEGFPNYLPPAGPTMAVPKYTPGTFAPTPGASGYPGLELPEGAPVFRPSLLEAEPMTPGKGTATKYRPGPTLEQIRSTVGKNIPRKGPPALPEAGTQAGGRTFIQNEDGSITEVKPVKKEGKVIPKPGPQEPTPTLDRAGINAMLHAKVQRLNLPGSGPGSKAPGYLTNMAQRRFNTSYDKLTLPQMRQMFDMLDEEVIPEGGKP